MVWKASPIPVSIVILDSVTNTAQVRLNIFYFTSLNIFRAGDMVKCVQAVLEHHDKMEDSNLPFLQSLDILARSQSDKLDQSTKLAKIQLELVVKQVQNVIDTKQVISAGPLPLHHHPGGHSQQSILF